MAFLNQDEDQNQSTAPSAIPSATSPAPASSPMASPQTMANQPKGSGRFTNIQKYINANQGAGQRLASGVEKRVQAQVNPNVEKSQSQASQIAEQVNKAKGTLGQGQALQAQVSDKNFDATGFAAQEPNVQQFTQFRTGQAIDENALRSQAEQAQMQALQGQQQAQGFNQQLGTEAGRQQLLKQTFSPTRNYGVGQQRLDNLFLQQASPELRNISKNLNQTQQQLGNLGLQAEQKRQIISDLAGQEQQLVQGLTTAVGDRERDLTTGLENRIGEVNTQRGLEQQKYQSFLDNLLQSGQGKKIEGQLDENLIKELGLNLGQQTFNVLKNPTLSASEFLQTGRNANSIQDIAQQADVDKYQALAKLGGFDAKLTKAGELDKAASFKQGEGSIVDRVNQAKTKFLEDAINQNLVGSGAWDWKSKDTFRGKKGTERASATLNLNDVLGGDYEAAMANASNSKAGTLAQQIVQNDMGDLSGLPLPLGLANMPGRAIGTGIDAITNALPGVFGDPNAGKQQRARAEAQRIANEDVKAKLDAYLRQQGFDQYLGSEGITSGGTKLEDFGYGQADKSQSGRFNFLKNPKVT